VRLPAVPSSDSVERPGKDPRTIPGLLTYHEQPFGRPGPPSGRRQDARRSDRAADAPGRILHVEVLLHHADPCSQDAVAERHRAAVVPRPPRVGISSQEPSANSFSCDQLPDVMGPTCPASNRIIAG